MCLCPVDSATAFSLITVQESNSLNPEWGFPAYDRSLHFYGGPILTKYTDFLSQVKNVTAFVNELLIV